MDEFAINSSPERKRGLLLRSFVWLTCILGIAFALAAAWQAYFGTWTGFTAIAIAASSSWIGASLALVIAALARGPNAAILALGCGMATRMGLPLLVGIAAHIGIERMATAGILIWTVLFYLSALATETPLSLGLVQRAGRQVNR